MADLEDRIRSAFDPSPPVSMEEVIRRASEPRRRGGRALRPRWLIVGVACLVVAGLVATLTLVLQGPGHANVSVVSGNRGTTPRPLGTPPTTAAPAHPSLVMDLSLSRTRAVADGAPIKGRLTVTNTTGHPVPSDTCGTGRPIEDDLPAGGGVEIGLTNARVPYTPGQPLPACTTAYYPAGTSSYSVEVSTVWWACNDPPAPRCPLHGLPVLPPGRYVTDVLSMVPSGTARLPRPIAVTLVAR